MSVPFDKLEGSAEENLEKLEISNKTLAAVQSVLEDNEKMNILTEKGSDEIRQYVKLQIVIGEVEKIVKKIRKKGYY